MNINAIKKTYRRYANIYDILFGQIFNPGRAQVIRALDCRSGDRVLEVGVGTGLSLPLYPHDARVTGIDISAEMLDKAERRVQHDELPQVEELLEMDAEQMRFADNSFDKVVAMYVVSVSPNPDRLVDEMRRVCRPGGEIFIVNHFHSRNPVLGFFERLFAPLSKWMGFRPDLDLDQFIRDTGLEVIEVSNANLFGYWKVLRCRNGAKVALAS